MDERFGLTSQMRRSSYSAPTNVAEATGRRSWKERANFLDYAIGSVEELHYQCLLSHELGYLTNQQLEEVDDKIQRVGFLLHRLRESYEKHF